MATIRRFRGGYRLDFFDALNVRQRLQFRTKTEAEAAAQRLIPLRAQRRRASAYDARLTVAEWARHWLAQVRPTVKPRTAESYAAAIERRIIPALGALRLTTLDRPMLRTFLLDCRAAGRADGQPLAANSVRLILAPLSAMLARAVEDGLLPSNPAHGLGGRHGLRLQANARQRRQRIEGRVLTPEQLEALLVYTHARAPHRFPLLLTYATTGLRLGEAVALEVDDFDPAGTGTLRVRQQADYKSDRLGTPKQGTRMVDLAVAPDLVAVLQRQVAFLRRRGLETGSPARWLFPSETGTRLASRNVNRIIADLGRRAGIPHPISPHDLRHTYATRLIDAGVSPVYVQRQLGHASIQLTVDTYAGSARPGLPPTFVGLFNLTAGPHEPAATPPPRPCRAVQPRGRSLRGGSTSDTTSGDVPNGSAPATWHKLGTTAGRRGRS